MAIYDSGKESAFGKTYGGDGLTKREYFALQLTCAMVQSKMATDANACIDAGVKLADALLKKLNV